MDSCQIENPLITFFKGTLSVTFGNFYSILVLCNYYVFLSQSLYHADQPSILLVNMTCICEMSSVIVDNEFLSGPEYTFSTITHIGCDDNLDTGYFIIVQAFKLESAVDKQNKNTEKIDKSYSSCSFNPLFETCQ